jgi:DNA-binding Lrp family transcriptional regulator
MTELDDRVLSYIKENPGKFFRDVSSGVGLSQSRKVDRSLQRLRKAGKISFTPGLGWNANSDIL